MAVKINNMFDPNNFNLDNIKLDSAKIFSFELELPDFEGTLSELQEDKEFVQMFTAQENPGTHGSAAHAQLEEAWMNLMKSLQLLAQKDKIPVKMGNINDIKLFINSRDLTGINEGYRINMDSLSKDDIEFFKLCSEKNEITVNDINAKNSQVNVMAVDNNNQVSYKSFDFSKGLFNLIEYSFKKQKPIRLDFRGNSSVILKVNNQGKLSAEFISNDTAMEYILRNSIPNLKNKLDSEGIPYEKVFYRDKENSGKNKKNKGGKR